MIYASEYDPLGLPQALEKQSLFTYVEATYFYKSVFISFKSFPFFVKRYFPFVNLYKGIA